MSSYKSKVVNNTIFDKVSGELDAELANLWVKKLEEDEANFGRALNRIHDVREINAIHLSFDELWSIAQRRMELYKSGIEARAAFWVSTPLNYGVARMYQALTDGTPFIIEVFYKIEEVAQFMNIDKSVIENIDL